MALAAEVEPWLAEFETELANQGEPLIGALIQGDAAVLWRGLADGVAGLRLTQDPQQATFLSNLSARIVNDDRFWLSNDQFGLCDLPKSVSLANILNDQDRLLAADFVYSGDFILRLEGDLALRKQELLMMLSAVSPKCRRDAYFQLINNEAYELFFESARPDLPTRVLRALAAGNSKAAWKTGSSWNSVRSRGVPGTPLHPAQTLRTIKQDSIPTHSRYLSVARVALGKADPSSRQPLHVAAGIAETQRASQRKAIAEAIERFTIRAGNIDETLWATEDELRQRAESFMRVDEFYRFRPEQLAQASELLASNASEPQLWAKIRNVEDKTATWIPASVLSTTSPSVNVPALACSSGASAHRTVDSAICHSIGELIERDAFLRWWHLGMPFRLISTEASPGKEMATFHLRLSAVKGWYVVLTVIARDSGLVAGLACAIELEEAVIKSHSESLMIASHWPTRHLTVPLVKTPLDHTHFWANCGKKLRDRVIRRIEGTAVQSIGREAPTYPRFLYTQLIAPIEIPDYRVVRVVSPDLLTMYFGIDSIPLGNIEDQTVSNIKDWWWNFQKRVPHILG